MSVFNENVLTPTALSEGADRAANPKLLGRGKAAGVATPDFLDTPQLHSGTEQLLTTGDASIFLAGKLTAALNEDFYDYVYGSVYSITMGSAITTVVGKQRGWYRGLPDGDTTASSYYDGIDTVDPTVHSGYDPGEASLEVRAVFNDKLLAYQWQGLTQVRLVDDNIVYGTEQQPINVQDYQYGDMTSRVHGNDSATVHGDSYATFQGDRTRNFNAGAHTVVVLGADLTQSVGHESAKDTNARFKDAEKEFNDSEAAVLQGVGANMPANAQTEKWGDFAQSQKQRMPMTFDATQGVNLILNLNIAVQMVLVRNALSVVGVTGRFVKLRHTMGKAILTAVQTKFAALVAGITAVSARIGVFFGIPRVIPAPPPDVELAELPPAIVAAPAGAFTAGTLDAMGMSAEEIAAAAAEAETAAAEAAAEQAIEEAMAALRLEAFEEESAAAEQLLADAMQALKDEEAAEAAAAEAPARAQGVAAAWGAGGFAGVVGILGGLLTGLGSTGKLGNALPDSSLGQGEIDDEPDNSQPGGFEIPSS